MSRVSSVGSRQIRNKQYRPDLNSATKIVFEKKMHPSKPVFVDCNYQVALTYINSASIKVKPKLRLQSPNTTQFFCQSADDKAELINMLKEKQKKRKIEMKCSSLEITPSTPNFRRFSKTSRQKESMQQM